MNPPFGGRESLLPIASRWEIKQKMLREIGDCHQLIAGWP